jgi:hypothetical protein
LRRVYSVHFFTGIGFKIVKLVDIRKVPDIFIFMVTKMTYKYDGMSDEEELWHPDDYSVEKDNSTFRSYVRRIKYSCEYDYDE